MQPLFNVCGLNVIFAITGHTFAINPATGKVDLIYNRFSSEMQRVESNADQQRRCRDLLDRKGIPHVNFGVIADEAISGQTDARPGFAMIIALKDAGMLGNLACSEQSRFSRGDNAKSQISDIVYHGGRFLTATEGIDTADKNWKLLVSVGEIHHSQSNDDTAERVRGGQEGRVQDGDGSAGDYPYGYTSVFANPAAAAVYTGRGPKPKRNVVILEETAKIVRWIFTMFVSGESIAEIVRRLNADRTIPRVGEAAWHHEHVRRMLKNSKYIGNWKWGETTTIRSGSKKKQIAALPHQQVTKVDRPGLRIVDDAIHAQAQFRLAKLVEIYGMKQGGKKRGPAEHYRLLYPKRLLNGKIICPKCKRRFVSSGSNKTEGGFLGCPLHKSGSCSVATRVSIRDAEKAIISILDAVFSGYPEFLDRAVAAMSEILAARIKDLPSEREVLTRQIQAKRTELNRLIDLSVKTASTTVADRINEVEAEVSSLRSKESDLGQVGSASVELPNSAWVKAELKTLSEILTDAKTGTLVVIRDILGEITAEEVIAPGKTRGYMRLRFRLQTWALIRQAVKTRVPAGLLSLLPNRDDGEEFVIDLGQPTRMDQWGPQIAQWRAEKVKWVEIEKRTGLQMANAYVAMNRYLKSKNPAA